MIRRKYELTGETKVWNGVELYRIRALIPFGIIMEGEPGGWIESEENLSQDGAAWVCRKAQVYGNARIYGNAHVSGAAQVFGAAQVYGDTQVYGKAQIFGTARVFGTARMSGTARVERSSDYLTISPIGAEDGVFTAYRTENGIECNLGVFSGTLDGFATAMQSTHSDDELAKQYQAVISMVRLRFGV